MRLAIFFSTSSAEETPSREICFSTPRSVHTKRERERG